MKKRWSLNGGGEDSEKRRSKVRSEEGGKGSAGWEEEDHYDGKMKIEHEKKWFRAKKGYVIVPI